MMDTEAIKRSFETLHKNMQEIREKAIEQAKKLAEPIGKITYSRSIAISPLEISVVTTPIMKTNNNYQEKLRSIFEFVRTLTPGREVVVCNCKLQRDTADLNYVRVFNHKDSSNFLILDLDQREFPVDEFSQSFFRLIDYVYRNIQKDEQANSNEQAEKIKDVMEKGLITINGIDYRITGLEKK